MQTLIKPEWIKIRYKSSSTLENIKKDVRAKGLATVCQESLCPNVSECWNGGTATFMLMGDTCTRGCAFCHVKTAVKPGPLDEKEHEKLLESVQRMKLDYVVLTSVDRDDLPDQGAAHLAHAIRFLKEKMPSLKIEILIPDFQGKRELVQKIVNARPHVIAHNVETVERLTPRVRDRRAGYRQSLSVLRMIKEIDPSIYTKSSIMVGVGEKEGEIAVAMDDLRAEGVSFLTVGQYLQPSQKQMPVRSFVHPDTFKYYEQLGREKGFLYVAAGPFVRSSYKAGELFISSILEGNHGR